MALSANRNTIQMADSPIASKIRYPVAASTHIYQGSLVAIDKSGNLIVAPATVPAGGCVIVGRSDTEADNSSGSAGALTATVTQGIFKWFSGTVADVITVSDAGLPCYASDGQTVCRTDNGGTRAFAGYVVQVDTDGVWVETRLTKKDAGKQVLNYAIDLASIANGTILAFKPGFGGRITRVEFNVAKPVTTGAKLSTLTPNIAGVAVTGGVLSLTSAACTPTGTNVAGSAVTALNQFGAQDTISIVASATTAFSEGTGTLSIYTE